MKLRSVPQKDTRSLEWAIAHKGGLKKLSLLGWLGLLNRLWWSPDPVKLEMHPPARIAENANTCVDVVDRTVNNA